MRVKYILTFKEVMSALNSKQDNPPTFNINKYPLPPIAYDMGLVTACKTAFEWRNNSQIVGKEYAKFPFFQFTGGSWNMTPNCQLIVNSIFGQYGEEAIAYSLENNETEIIKASSEALNSILNVLEFTYDKYDKLLSLYDTQKTKLLNQIESSNGLTHSVAISETDNTDEATTDNMSANSSSENSGFNKFKDTPQSAVTIDSLGDDYNTDVNITKSETSGTDQSAESISRDIDRSLSRVENVTDAGTNKTDRDTPMARLDEIQRLYRKVLEQWVNEFKMLFWPIDNHFEMEE